MLLQVLDSYFYKLTSGRDHSESTYYISFPSQHQMWLQSELSGSNGSGPGVVRLDPSTSDDTVAAFLLSISKQEFKFTNLKEKGAIRKTVFDKKGPLPKNKLAVETGITPEPNEIMIVHSILCFYLMLQAIIISSPSLFLLNI